MRTKLLSNSTKLEKGTGSGYLTAGMYLAPSTGYVEDGANLCPWASDGCSLACLAHESGRMVFDSVQQAQTKRRELFLSDLDAFMEQLGKELKAHIRKASKLGLTPCFRPNASSDIDWVALGLVDRFPDLQMYDYTKNPARMKRDLPANYHLTFSRSESNHRVAIKLLASGKNVAVPFHPTLPEQWEGFPVFDGDQTDLRFTDPKYGDAGVKTGFVIGLKAKGSKAKSDKSGFVIHTN